MKFLALLLLGTLAACGESPLLNHKLEPKNFITRNNAVESESYSFRKAGLDFSIFWNEGPAMGGSRFTMKIWKSATGTINGPFIDPDKNLHIFLWMPSMGHGSAPVKIKKLAAGEYEVSDVHFIMGGKWEVKFQLKDGNSVYDESVLSLSL